MRQRAAAAGSGWSCQPREATAGNCRILSDRDIDIDINININIIGQALRAAILGTFFPDWEFATLFGLERAEVRVVAETWPTQTIDPDAFFVAARGALLYLCGYPHNADGQLKSLVSIDDTEELQVIPVRLDAIRPTLHNTK
ncbi:hypothetical protein [Reyranella sp.]|uniref:hypothetical protein n=1 Tax=Reyranella sp. TaxID=1929291 RepID=UPI004035CF44